MNLQEIKEQKLLINGESAILGEQISTKLDVINDLKKSWVGGIRTGRGIEMVEMTAKLKLEEDELEQMQEQLEQVADKMLSLESETLKEIEKYQQIRTKKLDGMKSKADKLKKIQSDLIHGLAELHEDHEEIQKINRYLEYVNMELGKEKRVVNVETGYDVRTTSQFIRSLLVPHIKGVRM